MKKSDLKIVFSTSARGTRMVAAGGLVIAFTDKADKIDTAIEDIRIAMQDQERLGNFSQGKLILGRKALRANHDAITTGPVRRGLANERISVGSSNDDPQAKPREILRNAAERFINHLKRF